MKYIIGALAVCIAIACTWWLLDRYTERERAERSHFEGNETQLFISNLANASIELRQAGTSLDNARTVQLISDDIWLPAGNYFIIARREGKTWFYPVPLLGYRRGPERNGSFAVTIRPLPDELPPRLESKGPHFVYIPSGEFLIGDRLNPGEQHYVWLTGYFISPFEVTNAQFREFLTDPSGYANDTNWTSAGRHWKAQQRSQATALLTPSDKDYGRFGQPDQPVVWVTWYEAYAFCVWLTSKLGNRRWLFTLPNDAEWEKAARGPDNFDYSLGMTISDVETPLYNWKKNPAAPVTVVGVDETMKRYRPNRYGLYHMTGNVAEWSLSITTTHNREKPYRDDQRNHADTPGSRSARGGSWYSAATSYLYIPYRDSFQPEHCNQELGFRIVAKRLP